MTREEQDKEIAYVFKNKEIIAAEKRNTTKHADVVLNRYVPNARTAANKAELSHAVNDPSKLIAKLVINTTNIIDSHLDCHIPGLWTKTLQETDLFFLLQEHEMDFDMVIADSVNDNLKAYTESIPWSTLGYSYKGNTEALIFDVTIKKERNEFMFNQYAKGYVLNHSVGMRYVKLYLCVNREDSEYTQEKENWDKYYPMVVNKDAADERGYFWAVTEAKMIEGSAVVKGSNQATPVLSVEASNKEIEAAQSTSTPEPTAVTPKTTISNYLF